ncbi:MAG: hypothetical protein AAGI50_04960 [Pseudomonadota bacterium]
MPLVELILSDQATLEAEALGAELCAHVISALGGDPEAPATQEITRCEIRRLPIISAGHRAPDAVRVNYLLPEGALSRPRKARLAERTTERVLKALGREDPDAARNVWVTVQETPAFAAAGRFWTPREIAEWVLRRRLAASA